MRQAIERTLQLGRHEVSLRRYKGYRVRTEGGHPFMDIRLDCPRGIITLKGNEDIALAIQEIQQQCEEASDERIGGHWHDLGIG